ncbi:MAG: hypothetical protein EXQ90_05670 [Rhodospirillales bacterium]|nr:hypothetical protein [Rhodospirillales bacterium]
MKLKQVIAVGVVGGMLTACQSIQDSPKQTGGTLIGAGLGALAGSQIGGGTGALAAVAIGALAGGWLGGEAGKSLDRADRVHAEQTTQNSLERNTTGQTSSWQNPDSRNTGTVTPTITYQMANGHFCRDFEQTIVVDGKSERATGRACREQNGEWRVVQ